MPSLRDTLHRLEVLIAQLRHLEIAIDALGRRALGQHHIASPQTPGKQHLRQRITTAIRDLIQRLIRAHLLTSRRDLVLRAQRRVRRRQDIVLLAKLHQLGVRQERVNLNLVNRRFDLGERKQLLQALDSPVRHANRAHLARLVEFLHGAPRRLRVLSELLLNDVLPIGAQLGHVVGVALGGNGPVHEEQVDVVGAQFLERVFERPLDFVGLVQVVPDFCADEDVLAGDVLVLFQEIGDGVTDLGFVLVEPCAVEMAVAGLEGVGYGAVGFAFGALVGEGVVCLV